jgi:probable phosphoglycerate mutase
MLLARHGQSEWNALGRWQGQADPPLSALGRRQALAAADRLGTVDAIVSSDLDRAVTTAAIIAEALGVGPVLVEPRLRERSAGEWSGLTRDEIEAEWPGYLAEHRRPPGFESDGSLLARTTAALAELAAAQPDAELLVVTHGGVVYVLESDAGLPFARLPNLSGRWLAHEGGRIALGDRVELVPETLADQPPGKAVRATQPVGDDDGERV